MITMKLDKERISKIKSNIEVDLEFLQEARQERKSFEPFDYDDNADAFFNTIEVTLDDNSKIDREKLFRLIRDSFHDIMFFGEIDRYINTARFGEFEIEYSTEG